MKQICLAATAIVALSGPLAFACDEHEHSVKGKKETHAHKGKACQQYKQGEKSRKCDHKDGHGDHAHNEDKKESK